jgi:predicted lipid-binding transport protein (Tim44 family)
MNMKKQRAFLFLLACGLVLTSALFTADAQAKRLGAGKSLGRQSSGVLQRQQVTPTPAAAPKQAAPSPAAVQPRPASRWGGILGGLAAGIGLAALFHAFGFGAGMASFVTALLLAALAFFAVMALMRVLRRQSGEPIPQPAGMPRVAYDAAQLGQESYLPPQRIDDMSAAGAGGSPAQGSIPANFDQRAFLNKAREHYYQLQKAWDAGDLSSIESYTTPELFAQLRGEIQQRGSERNQTDVVTLEAVLLELQEQQGEYLASVEFSGLVREESWGGAQPMREIWNLVKPVSGSSGWLLAGIQQIG